MGSSSISSTGYSSNESTASSDMSSGGIPSSSIASLPSFAHSLSAFPTMTSVSSDMVHYGTLGRTKKASEAKLNSVLQTAKQKNSGAQQPASGMSPSLLTSPLESPDDEHGLVISRKRTKTSINALA